MDSGCEVATDFLCKSNQCRRNSETGQLEACVLPAEILLDAETDDAVEPLRRGVLLGIFQFHGALGF